MSAQIKIIKCLVLYSGDKNDEVAIKKHGAILSVDAEYLEDDHVIFSIIGSDLDDIDNQKFNIGPSSMLIGLVLKIGNESTSIEAIYSDEEVKPKMCCYCGRVKVCAYWCSC
ncbi:TPA: hypothetical protein REX04_005183 [Klebsiella pneumoniae]|nr:hypothetical protein [Klebsiella pneumoniae]